MTSWLGKAYKDRNIVSWIIYHKIYAKMISIGQTKINEWDIIREQIERSKIPRINWKKIFNQSLTKLIADCYAHKLSSTETYNFLCNQLEQKGMVYPHLLKNLKISVCARYAEIRSESKQIIETQKNIELGQITKQVWGIK